MAGRSVKDSEVDVPSTPTHVFSGNAVVIRVLDKLLNKAERELQELKLLKESLRRKARRAANSSDVSRTIGVESSALEQALRPLLIPLVGGAARLFMRVCNTTSVRGAAAAWSGGPV